LFIENSSDEELPRGSAPLGRWIKVKLDVQQVLQVNEPLGSSHQQGLNANLGLLSETGVKQLGDVIVASLKYSLNIYDP